MDMKTTLIPSCTREDVLSKTEEDLIERLAFASRILSIEGHDDFNQGQVSARIPKKDYFFIKKAIVGFSEAKPSDMVKAYPDVEKHSSPLSPPELPLHQAIYAVRPDVNAIIHSHAPYSLIFGATNMPLKPISHDGAFFKDRIGRFDKTSQTILTIDIGNKVAEALGQLPALFLQNHGVLVVGKSLREATILALILERACKLQIIAESTGHEYSISSDTDVKGKQDYIYGDTSIKTYWDYSVRRIEQLGLVDWEVK